MGCRKCPQQYIGETERTLKERFSEHKGYVNTNNQSKATGVHFNTKGHSVADMEITVIQKIFSQDPMFRKQREKFYIQKFNTRYKGLNRMNGGWRIANCNLFLKISIWYSSSLFLTMLSCFESVWCGIYKKFEIYHW